MDALQFTLLLVALSVLPPVLFTVWVRNQEQWAREPTRAVMKAFLYGALVGTTLALILNTVFDTASYYYGLDVGLTGGILTAVVVAPFIEEATKGAGLGFQKGMMSELEDGLVYGAAIGLGFAATENIFYGISAWMENGQSIAIQTLVLRSISSTVLHGGTSALLGFGYARAVLDHDFGVARIIPYYLIAVVVHSGYNLLVSIGNWYALILAILMAWFILMGARKRIVALDTLPHQRT